MKKLLLSLLVFALIAGGLYAYQRWFYVEDPKDAFLRTASSAMLGDEEGFLAGFTDDSRPLVSGLLALSRSDDVRTSARHPYHFLVTEHVVAVAPEGPDRVWLKLQRTGDSASAKYDVPLQKVGKTWKIDALAFNGKEHTVVQK